MRPDEIINAKLTAIHIGTMYHDGRGFATLTFEGDGWGQGACFRVEKTIIDGLIQACGAQHLFDCIGKYCRIVRGGGQNITAVMHIMRTDYIVNIRD